MTIHFEPQAPTEAFVKAAAEYDAIWKAESARIVEAMERITGARFEEREIKAVVYQGTSFSGSGNTPMRLRAELSGGGQESHGHSQALSSDARPRPDDELEIDEHRKLFLVLYDIWVTL